MNEPTIGERMATKAAREVKLAPEHMAVVAALERLVSHLALEANQLGAIYKQTGPATFLGQVATQLVQQRDNFVRESQQRIIVPEVQLASAG